MVFFKAKNLPPNYFFLKDAYSNLKPLNNSDVSHIIIYIEKKSQTRKKENLELSVTEVVKKGLFCRGGELRLLKLGYNMYKVYTVLSLVRS